MPRVTFEPGGRCVEVECGERLLVAAWRAGAALKSVCGGRGQCGGCLVEIDRDAALSAAHADEAARLPEATATRHCRLACLAQVEADVRVRIPLESEALRVPPRKPFRDAPVAAAPLVSNLAIDIAGPREVPPRPLADRIGAALRTAGVRQVEIPVAALAGLSTTRQFDAVRRLTATLFDRREVIRLQPGGPRGLFGLALDVGTTSLAAFLCDLEAGRILGVRTATNPQAAYGEDVISRMTQVQRDIRLLARMQAMVVDELSRMAGELAAEAGIAPEDIVDAVAVGNPTMQHILLGINPESLGRGACQPVLAAGTCVRAAEVGLRVLPTARLFVLPTVGGYIGGDTLAAVLTQPRSFLRGTHLLIDVGTNGEAVLGHHGRLTAISCATGPVYEGAHIRCGVRAAPGAIERVWLTPEGGVELAVIPDAQKPAAPLPLGLCGSGVISAVAALVNAGILHADGRLLPGSHPAVRSGREGAGEFVVVPAGRSGTGRDIVLTQADVRNVQLGKAALRAGIEILLREQGVQRLDSILLAGTFGNHLDPDDILRIGMVPPIRVRALHSIGNAAGDGARMALLNRRQRQRAHRLARRIRVLELATRPDFQALFIACTLLAADPLVDADIPA